MPPLHYLHTSLLDSRVVVFACLRDCLLVIRTRLGDRSAVRLACYLVALLSAPTTCVWCRVQYTNRVRWYPCTAVMATCSRQPTGSAKPYFVCAIRCVKKATAEAVAEQPAFIMHAGYSARDVQGRPCAGSAQRQTCRSQQLVPRAGSERVAAERCRSRVVRTCRSRVVRT